ncbi:MAG: phosphoribosylformylglycinamidine synthase subunit PurL [Methanobacteriaceae archaeon]|nr:phosphoribosylformylglycinamidine synthase subunit PurL [Methanobacteriaceae archaeon]
MVLSDSELELIKSKLNRKPNELELGMLDIMFSEHCSYKSSRPVLGLFPTDGENVILGPGDDAGLVSLNDTWALAIGMESHNHPSAVEPYGGAGTGIGGIVRDIISMGAFPVVLLDALRFGHLDDQRSCYIFENVVKGISDYGNRIGVPTVGGEVEFDDNFQFNPLVNVVCAGLVRKDEIVYGSAPVVGDVFVLMGGRTGRDGIHGVTFASEELTSDSEIEDRPAVQVADPFTKKRVMEATFEILENFDVHGVKDLGGGGLTCCISEMADKAGNGSEVDLESIPLREENMTPYEIMLSESQERMVFAISPEDTEAVFKVFDKHDLPHAIIGNVTNTKEFIIKKDNEIISRLPNNLLSNPPVIEREAKKPEQIIIEKETPETDPENTLKTLLKSENLTNKEWIYKQYDHDVQTRTIVRPGDDAAIIKIDDETSFAITTDCNSTHVLLNPYHGGAGAVLESISNLTSMGATPLCIVDCLNFGNPEKPEVFWQFKECVKGMSKLTKKFETPVISGNVSFYNETEGVTVNPSPIISAVGKIDDNKQIKTMPLKNQEDKIIIIGNTYNELNGSQYYKIMHDLVQGDSPQIRLEEVYNITQNMQQLIKEENNSITAVHDISKGGLVTALALMGIKGNQGINIDISNIPSTEQLTQVEKLYSETYARYIITIKPEQEQEIINNLENLKLPYQILGKVTGTNLIINNNENTIINIPIEELIKNNTETIEKHMA